MNVWFVVNFVTTWCSSLSCCNVYSCDGDSDKQNRFDQSNISNYSRRYVEELELQIF